MFFYVTTQQPILQLHLSVDKPHTTHNSSIRSDERLTLETSAFESFYSGQFTLLTQLIKPNYLAPPKYSLLSRLGVVTNLQCTLAKEHLGAIHETSDQVGASWGNQTAIANQAPTIHQRSTTGSLETCPLNNFGGGLLLQQISGSCSFEVYYKTVEAMNSMFARFGVPFSLRTDNGRQFVSEEFESFLRAHSVVYLRLQHCDVKLTAIEVECRNRLLFECLYNAKLEGKNWRPELGTWLAAYRSTPQTTQAPHPSTWCLVGRWGRETQI